MINHSGFRLTALLTMSLAATSLLCRSANAEYQVNAGGFVSYRYFSGGSFATVIAAEQYGQDSAAVSSLNKSITAGGARQELQYSFSGGGAGGQISFKLSRSTPPLVRNPDLSTLSHSNYAGFAFEANSFTNQDGVISTSFPLPVDGGTFRWKHAVTPNARTFSNATFAIRDAIGNGPGPGGSGGGGGSFGDRITGSDTVRFGEGFFLSLNAVATFGDHNLYTEPFQSRDVASGSAMWTTGPSFPGDTPENPIVVPKTSITSPPPPFTDDGDDQLIDEGGTFERGQKGAKVAGVNLVGPATGGSGTAQPMYFRFGNSALSATTAMLFGVEANATFSTPSSKEVLISSFGQNFASFEIPNEAGQAGRAFSLSFGDAVYTYTPGTSFDFTAIVPAGINQFGLVANDEIGFNPDEVGIPFVHGFRFTQEGLVNVWEQTLPIPEPASVALCVVALLGLISQRRRGLSHC